MCERDLPRQSWEELSQLPEEKKKAFFETHLKRLRIKEISEIRVGDHLVKSCSILNRVVYEHHFLCTSETPKMIVHYQMVPYSTLLRKPVYEISKWSKIQEMPIEEYLTDLPLCKVQRVVWPQELKRYPDHEVVRRAKSRLGETEYSLMSNNCETYIMWCLFDIEHSTQSASIQVRILF